MEFNPNDAVTVRLDDDLPAYPSFAPGIRRAPRREAKLWQPWRRGVRVVVFSLAQRPYT